MTFGVGLKNFFEKFMPDILIERLDKLIQPDYFSLKHTIKKYFLNLDYEEQELEIKEIINYFKKYRYSDIPYKFIKNYIASDIHVYFEKEYNMPYVLHNKKRLYFPKNWNKEAIKRYYNALRMEQDIDSPHRYENENFSVAVGDIIADIGAAEGIWSLDNADNAGKIYLFECEKKWINTLEKTFEPWRKKTVIVNKYVSDVNDTFNVTLDKFFKGNELNFIKVDIEGMETKLLEGSKELLKKENLRLLMCTYHKKNDAEMIKKTLENNGYKTEYSKGYMFHIDKNEFEEPYIRRGIIRGRK
jgi:hypothetical protein